jgi:hypothetical protein
VTAFLAAVASGVALLALLAGSAAHLSRPAGLPKALRAHGLLPERLVRVTAAVVTAVEGLLAAGGGAALLTGSRGALVAVLCAAVLLFGTYTLYTRYALTTGHGGPCGCARTELPLSGWITVRAGALALLAAAGATLTGPAAAAAPAGGAQQALALLAALTLGLLLWTLPAAMHDPSAPPRTTGSPTPAGITGGPQWTS